MKRTETDDRHQHRIECPHRAPLKGSKKIACRHLDTYCTGLTLCPRMRKYDLEVLGILHQEDKEFGEDALVKGITEQV